MLPNFTKNLMKDNFMKMLDERNFNKITVTEVVQTCCANRNTFYYYFADLEDMLRYGLHEWFVAELAETGDLAEALHRITSHEDRMVNIYKSTKGAVLLSSVEELAALAVAQYLDEKEPGESKTEAGQETIEFARVLFSGLMLNWLNSPSRYDIRGIVNRAWQRFVSTHTK